eukprot:4015126-Lingulodinium_polyedra.AAC.1
MQACRRPEGGLSLRWRESEVCKEPEGVSERVAQVAQRPGALFGPLATDPTERGPPPRLRDDNAC